MKPSVEYGHLYKFAVSAGVALIALAGILPWAILRESGVLMVAEANLDTYTEVAQSALATKQRHSAAIADYWPVCSAGLLLGGLLLVWFGLRRWSRRQLVHDRLEDVELALRERGLEKLDPADAAQRMSDEFEESKAAEDSAGVTSAEPDVSQTARGDNAHPSRAPVDRAPSDAAERPSIGGSRSNQGDAKRADPSYAQFAHVESTMRNLFERAFTNEYRVMTDVRIASSAGASLVADLVALPRERNSRDLVVEVKYSSRHASTLVLKKAFDRLAAFVDTLRVTSRHADATGLLVLVVDGDVSKARGSNSLEKARQVVATEGARRMSSLVVHRRELDSMSPPAFRNLVLAAIDQS